MLRGGQAAVVDPESLMVRHREGDPATEGEQGLPASWMGEHCVQGHVRQCRARPGVTGPHGRRDPHREGDLRAQSDGQEHCVERKGS